MPRYMIQEVPTPQTAAALLRNPEDRIEPVRRLFEEVGGSLEEYYVSFSEMTAFLVADFPDQATLDTITAAIFAGGGLMSIRATPIIAASKAVDVYKRAARLPYRPPGG